MTEQPHPLSIYWLEGVPYIYMYMYVTNDASDEIVDLNIGPHFDTVQSRHMVHKW